MATCYYLYDFRNVLSWFYINQTTKLKKPICWYSNISYLGQCFSDSLRLVKHWRPNNCTKKMSECWTQFSVLSQFFLSSLSVLCQFFLSSFSVLLNLRKLQLDHLCNNSWVTLIYYRKSYREQNWLFIITFHLINLKAGLLSFKLKF